MRKLYPAYDGYYINMDAVEVVYIDQWETKDEELGYVELVVRLRSGDEYIIKTERYIIGDKQSEAGAKAAIEHYLEEFKLKFEAW